VFGILAKNTAANALKPYAKSNRSFLLALAGFGWIGERNVADSFSSHVQQAGTGTPRITRGTFASAASHGAIPGVAQIF
jgi:hypothetical protein